MGKGIRLVMAVVAALGSAAASARAVEVVDRTTRYELVGHDEAALAVGLARLGPRTPTGRRSWAYTSWELSHQYSLKPVKGGCRVEQPSVRIEIETTLPSWTPTGAVAPSLRVRWRRMMDALVRHEAIHREHGLDAARQVAEDLHNLAIQSDCRGAERAAQRLLRRAVAEAGRRSRAFDRETQFGARDGVGL